MPADLLQSITSNLWAVLLIILFFGGSIFIHEFGHFLAARRRGVHVSRFSIGFGPKILSWRGKDGVEYRLSWLPLGGYVALPQLADMRGIEGESDTNVEQLPPVSYGTKILVFLAGAFFNLLFAAALATGLWIAGRPEPQHITTTQIGYVLAKVRLADRTEVASPAAEAGLKPGDIIRAIDGRRVRDWLDVQGALILGTGTTESGRRVARLTIERDGVVQELVVHPRRLGEENFRHIGVAPAYEPIAAKVLPESPAENLGLRAGDRFHALDGNRILSFDILFDHFERKPATSARLEVLRDGKPVTFVIPPHREGREHPLAGIEFTTNYQLLYQTPWDQFADVVDMTFRTLWSLIHPRGDIGLSNLSGPIGIGRGFWSAAQSDYPFRFAVWFAVLVNINLAIFNLLPIPVLDGGHMLFATIGRLRGRALPTNFVMTTQSVFMVLLLSLMLYVTVFDVRRWVRDARNDQAEAAAPSTEQPPDPAATDPENQPAAAKP